MLSLFYPCIYTHVLNNLLLVLGFVFYSILLRRLHAANKTLESKTLFHSWACLDGITACEMNKALWKGNELNWPPPPPPRQLCYLGNQNITLSDRGVDHLLWHRSQHFATCLKNVLSYFCTVGMPLFIMEMYMCKYVFLSTQSIFVFHYVQKWLQWVFITKSTRQKVTARLTAKIEKWNNIVCIKRHKRLKIMALLQHTSANIFFFFFLQKASNLLY